MLLVSCLPPFCGNQRFDQWCTVVVVVVVVVAVVAVAVVAVVGAPYDSNDDVVAAVAARSNERESFSHRHAYDYSHC